MGGTTENYIYITDDMLTSAAVDYAYQGSREYSWLLVSAAVFVICIIFLIVVGNSAVIVAVVTDKQLKQLQNWFIASLAVSDLFLGLLIMPLSLSKELIGYWYFGETLCAIWLATDVLLCTASILNLCMISIDRYMSVKWPHKYIEFRRPKTVAIAITLVWILSGIICFPPLVGWKRPQPLQSGYQFCVLSEETGYVVYSTVGSFFAPSTLMIVVYIKLSLVIMSRNRQHLTKARKPPGATGHHGDRSARANRSTNGKKQEANNQITSTGVGKLFAKRSICGNKGTLQSSIDLGSILRQTNGKSVQEVRVNMAGANGSSNDTIQLNTSENYKERSVANTAADMAGNDRYCCKCNEVNDHSRYSQSSTSPTYHSDQRDVDVNSCWERKNLLSDNQETVSDNQEVHLSADDFTLRTEATPDDCFYCDDSNGETNALSADDTSTGSNYDVKAFVLQLQNCAYGLSNQHSSITHNFTACKGATSVLPPSSPPPPSSLQSTQTATLKQSFNHQSTSNNASIKRESSSLARDALTSQQTPHAISPASVGVSAVENNQANTMTDSKVNSTVHDDNCLPAVDATESANEISPKDTASDSKPRHRRASSHETLGKEADKNKGDINSATRADGARADDCSVDDARADDSRANDARADDSGGKVINVSLTRCKHWLVPLKQIKPKSLSLSPRRKNQQALEKPAQNTPNKQKRAKSHNNVQYQPDRTVHAMQEKKRRMHKKRERRAFLVLGVIMVTFIVCWLPFFATYTISTLLDIKLPKLAFGIMFWLGYCNSALNPIIYTIFNKDFRNAFKRIFFRRR